MHIVHTTIEVLQGHINRINLDKLHDQFTNHKRALSSTCFGLKVCLWLSKFNQIQTLLNGWSQYCYAYCK